MKLDPTPKTVDKVNSIGLGSWHQVPASVRTSESALCCASCATKPEPQECYSGMDPSCRAAFVASLLLSQFWLIHAEAFQAVANFRICDDAGIAAWAPGWLLKTLAFSVLPKAHVCLHFAGTWRRWSACVQTSPAARAQKSIQDRLKLHAGFRLI